MKKKRKFTIILSLTLVLGLLLPSMNVVGDKGEEGFCDVMDYEECYDMEYFLEDTDEVAFEGCDDVWLCYDEVFYEVERDEEIEEVPPMIEKAVPMVEIAPFCEELEREPNRLYLPTIERRIPLGYSISDLNIWVQAFGVDEDVRREMFLTDEMVTGFDKTEVGKQELTVNLWGLSGTFYVDVFEVTSNHHLTLGRDGATILVDGSVEDSNMFVTIWDGETLKYWRYVSSDMVTGLDTSIPGNKNFTVSFGGLTVEANLNVISTDEIPTDAFLETEDFFVSSWPCPVVPLGGNINAARLFMYIIKNPVIGEPLTELASFLVTDDMVTDFDNTRVGWQDVAVTYKGFSKTVRVGVFDTSDMEAMDECDCGGAEVEITFAMNLVMEMVFADGEAFGEEEAIFIIYDDGVEIVRGCFEKINATTGSSLALLSGSFSGTICEANEFCFISTFGELTWRVELPDGVSALGETTGKVVLTEPEENSSVWFTVNLNLTRNEDGGDDGGQNNESTSRPNVRITKVASESTVDINNNIVYTITVRNTGTSAATNVAVSSVFPAQLTYVNSNTNARFNASNRTLTETIGPLEPGATATIRTTARATRAGTVEKTATVSGSNISDRSVSTTVVVQPAKTSGTTRTPAQNSRTQRTSPQTGDNFTFGGLVTSTAGLLLSFTFLSVTWMKGRMRKKELEIQAQIANNITNKTYHMMRDYEQLLK